MTPVAGDGDMPVPPADAAALAPLALAPGAAWLPGFGRADAAALLAAIAAVAAAAPFRTMVTPGGRPLSVAMTNCGDLGWISDRRGYRYVAADPATGTRWPAMPSAFTRLAAAAAAAAGFPQFVPDACLINRYGPGARLSLHRDEDERDFAWPIVSVSLGLPADFLWGGLRRSDRTRRLRLAHGDVVVWGGPARLAFHGVRPIADGYHPATGACRLNLTLRRAG
jgi:alkylated DNA repair protein (DNA oxidative demethylase)